MKNLILFLVFSTYTMTCCSQEMSCVVYNTFGIAASKKQFKEAKELKDLNTDYPSSWISKSDYVSSKLSLVMDGETRIAQGTNDQFNAAQKHLLEKAQIGSTIAVEVKYKVLNSITLNVDEKTMNFSISLVPMKEACFVGGEEQLNQFLREKTIDRFSAFGFESFEAAKILFTINAKGMAEEVEVAISSGNKEVDELLIDAIKKMPSWTPAMDAIGNPVNQKFQFNVGLAIGC